MSVYIPIYPQMWQEIENARQQRSKCPPTGCRPNQNLWTAPKLKRIFWKWSTLEDFLIKKRKKKEFLSDFEGFGVEETCTWTLSMFLIWKLSVANSYKSQ